MLCGTGGCLVTCRRYHFLYAYSDINKENYMSQLTRIAKHLRRNTDGPGITPGKLAFLAGVPKKAVYRRVSDLRNVEGKEIYSNTRAVNGRKRMFYRIAS